MNLNLLTIEKMVEQQVVDAQASSPALTDSNVTQGSVLRAIFQGVAGVLAWLQVTALDVLRASRLTTSEGEDVDSWMADYDQTRLPATFARGDVTFTRFSANQPAAVPPGTLVRTGDASLGFVVVVDEGHDRWNPVSGQYEIPAQTFGMTLPVEAVMAGSASKVVASAVSLLSSPVGMDTVTNAAAFEGGEDAESDAAFKARFRAYVASLAKATLIAVQAAVSGVRQGLRFRIDANMDPSGAFRPGHFTVTLDDGSGTPDADLVTDVALAVDRVKALAETFSVVGPTVVTPTVTLTIETAEGVDKALLLSPVRQAITAHIATLGIGQTLRFSRVASLAYGVSPNVTNVSGITLNGAQADINPGPRGLVLAGLVTVS